MDTSWPKLKKNYQNDETLSTLPQSVHEVKKYPCGCMPDCDLYEYPIESSFGLLDPNIYYSNGSLSKNPR